MALVLPIGNHYENVFDIVGSATFVKKVGKRYVFATCSHVLNALKSAPFLVIPPHKGAVEAIQDYAFSPKTLDLMDCEVLFTDPFNDLAFVMTIFDSDNVITPPTIITEYNQVNLGDKLSIFAYPLSLSNSFLLTSDVCFVTAKARRILTEDFGVLEYVANYFSVKGASGGGVFRHDDNKMVGILRGNLSKQTVFSTELNSTTSFIIPGHLITENLAQL